MAAAQADVIAEQADSRNRHYWLFCLDGIWKFHCAVDDLTSEDENSMKRIVQDFKQQSQKYDGMLLTMSKFELRAHTNPDQHQRVVDSHANSIKNRLIELPREKQNILITKWHNVWNTPEVKPESLLYLEMFLAFTSDSAEKHSIIGSWYAFTKQRQIITLIIDVLVEVFPDRPHFPVDVPFHNNIIPDDVIQKVFNTTPRETSFHNAFGRSLSSFLYHKDKATTK
jgi:hypothetical protein